MTSTPAADRRVGGVIRVPRRGAGTAAGLAAALVVLAGCAAGTEAVAASPDLDRPLEVVVSSYPLQFVAEEVGGDAVAVSNLTPPGADSHDLELTGPQVAELQEADLVVHLSGSLQPATDDALAASPPDVLVDAADVVDLQRPTGGEGLDPHFWLDPRLLAEVVDAVAAELSTVDPAGASGYQERAAATTTRLLALDDDLTAALCQCRGALLVTSHEAFGYLTRRHGIEQVGLAELDPAVPPTPARLRRVVDLVEGRDVRTVFFERSAGPRLTTALADDLGLQTAVLDPVERAPADGEDYETVMRANLGALATGLVCD